MSRELLTAYELVGGYGTIDILHGVSLNVGAGEIVTVIGPNGAGKSTAFKTIVGFLRPKSGRVVFNGEEITGMRPDLVLRRGLAYVPQGRLVFPQMTVLENLEMGAYTVTEQARIRTALARAYELFPILFERRRQKAGTLSGGEQQMLAIGRALMTAPRLILPTIEDHLGGLAATEALLEELVELGPLARHDIEVTGSPGHGDQGRRFAPNLPEARYPGGDAARPARPGPPGPRADRPGPRARRARPAPRRGPQAG